MLISNHLRFFHTIFYKSLQVIFVLKKNMMLGGLLFSESTDNSEYASNKASNKREVKPIKIPEQVS